MTTAHDLYRRWINELWAGRAVAGEIVTDDFVGHWPDRDVRGPAELEQIIDETRKILAELTFSIEIGPLQEGNLIAGRWSGTGRGPDGPVKFTGNDILRLADDGLLFAEYWTGTSAG
ncbi:nuclear transport factor 2 family protein [Mycobacterium asiaticum]|uniref:Polyketide cyclase n=1 Tax=Mycobacterium asiaticum TaxID=1790 RepID=A0A1A3NF49_MYCAS|nr:nuclear transport factor 2 family protein [Mycobacterium asiaticum]OBK19935.1 polyketide cyclase [Mycobacterium asiaticum]